MRYTHTHTHTQHYEINTSLRDDAPYALENVMIDPPPMKVDRSYNGNQEWWTVINAMRRQEVLELRLFANDGSLRDRTQALKLARPNDTVLFHGTEKIIKLETCMKSTFFH